MAIDDGEELNYTKYGEKPTNRKDDWFYKSWINLAQPTDLKVKITPNTIKTNDYLIPGIFSEREDEYTFNSIGSYSNYPY